MTTYTAVPPINPIGNTTGAVYAHSIALRAGSFPLRIIACNIIGANYLRFYRYTSGAISNGVVVTPTPAREGSLATTATCRYRSTSWNGSAFTQSSAVTITGTSALADTAFATSGSETGFKPAVDSILAPGSVFYAASIADTGTDNTVTYAWSKCVIYYEELRLAWSG